MSEEKECSFERYISNTIGYSVYEDNRGLMDDWAECDNPEGNISDSIFEAIQDLKKEGVFLKKTSADELRQARLSALQECREIALTDCKEQIEASENKSEAIQHRSSHAFAAQKLEELMVKIQYLIEEGSKEE